MRPLTRHLRRPDWTLRLAVLLENRRAAPLTWGTHDCCLFAADAIEAITGSDPAAAYRGLYTSQAEAEVIQGERGLEGLVADVLATFGAPECPLAHIQRGDVVLAVLGNEPLLGVSIGARISVPGVDRMVFLPMSAAVRAWAI